MTVEQKAEEYFETECPHSYADTEEQLKEDVVEAFQKGYHECEKDHEWHYTEDGDFPKHDHEVLCILWGGTKEVGYYKNEIWYFEDFTADKDDVDYWQEIKLPKEIE